MLLKKLGGWPVLEGDNWDAASFTWLQSVYKFREVGFSVDYFLDFSVTTDLKNSTKRTIDVSQSRSKHSLASHF
jgi:neprilysin